MERLSGTSNRGRFKVVNLVTERGVAMVQAAKDLDQHDNVLRKRVR